MALLLLRLAPIPMFQVHSMTVDWAAGNLYWTDAIFNRIMMSTLDYAFLHDTDVIRGQRVVIQMDLKEPWGLAVHPAKR